MARSTHKVASPEIAAARREPIRNADPFARLRAGRNIATRDQSWLSPGPWCQINLQMVETIRDAQHFDLSDRNTPTMRTA